VVRLKDFLRANGFDLATIIAIIISLIVASISAVDTLQYLNKPILIYDVDSRPYINGEFDSMTSIFIWNEGYTKADNVTIYLQTKGKIKQNLILKGEIGKEKFNISSDLKKIDDSNYILTIPFIVQNTEYDIHLLVNCRGRDPIDTMMIESENGGIARENRKNILYKYIGYLLPALAVFLILIIYIRKRRKDL
jgi:hypothetical protein